MHIEIRILGNSVVKIIARDFDKILILLISDEKMGTENANLFVVDKIV